MKTIAIIGATYNSSDAISSIMCPIINYTSNQTRIIFLGFGNSNNVSQINKNITNISIKNPLNYSFFYRLIRRLFIIFKIDDCKVCSKFVYKKIKKYLFNINLDLIISTSGRFCFTYATYKFAKSNNIKMRIVYFDPFVNNLYSRNKKKREKDENKWLSYVEKILYNADNEPPINNSNKFIPFKIPIYDKNKHIFNNNDNHNSDFFVYGGTFYKDIREPIGLYAFSKILDNSNYFIKCYSNLKNIDKDNKIEFYDIISHDKFIDVCNSSKGLIYIGNKGNNSVSSKFLEYISLKKVIIGIDVSYDDEVRKYPFYYDYNDKKLLDKIKYVKSSQLLSFNPYSVYPDRNPYKTVELFFK